MKIYAFGFWHVCNHRLNPLVTFLKNRGLEVAYENTWEGFKPHISWEQFLEYKGAKVLLLACDWNTSAHARGVSKVQELRSVGGLSLSIQHGEMLESDPEPMADIQCLWGEYYRTSKVKNPVITGNPYLDLFSDYNYEPRSALFVAPTHLAGLAGGSRELYAEQVKRVSQSMPVVMRPHISNGENLDWYTDLSNWATLSNKTNLMQNLCSSRMVFGYSSVLIEAAVLGIPAMEVRDNPTAKVDNLIYYHHSKPIEDIQVVNHADFAKLHNGGFAGQARNKIYSAILENI